MSNQCQLWEDLLKVGPALSVLNGSPEPPRMITSWVGRP